MMDAIAVYYLAAAGLIALNAIGLSATVFTLPGNWIILGASLLFALFFPAEDGRGLLWMTVATLAALAVVGEVLEFAAGALGAAGEGASRRAMVLAVVGAIVGSILGAVIGLPIPVLGPLVATLVGGGVGAFAGAYLGESWKGKASGERLAVSRAALVGRLLGTLGKLLVGLIMFVLVTVDLFL